MHRLDQNFTYNVFAYGKQVPFEFKNMPLEGNAVIAILFPFFIIVSF